MIELAIYWTGVVTLLSIGLLVSGGCIYFGCLIWMHVLTKELTRVCHHEQLRYFIRKIKKDGIKKTVDYAESKDCQLMPKDDK